MKTELKWGLIFTLVSLLWWVLEYAVGLHDKYISMQPLLTNLFAVPGVAMMYLAIREKKSGLGGRIGFTQALLCGAGVSVVVALLSPLTQYLFHRYINPRFFENAINVAVTGGRMTTEEATAFYSLKSFMLQASLGAIVTGVITSLIIALLVRTKSV